VATQDAADRRGVAALDRRDVEAELEAGATPGHPENSVAEALLGQGLPVLGSRQGDSRVRMQVVDVRGLDQAVHRGVDRRGRPTLAVQAVVKGGDHLVLSVHAGVDVGQ